jgi:MFS family permease
MDVPSSEQRPANLWRDSDFLKFWSAETASLIGSQISLIAIPLLAVTVLNADAFEMGVLNAAQFLPFLLLTLFAGVWVDRRRRLPMLIFSNFGRTVLFGVIPLAVAFDLMNVWLLSVLVCLAAALTVVFDLAYQSYLPSLIGRDQLIEGNSRLEGSRSFALLSGPGLAGVLVATVTAPIAILIDALTYLFSAVTLLFIKRVEPAPQARPADSTESIWTQIGYGVRMVLRNTYLRALSAEAAVYNLFNQMVWVVLVLYMVRELKLSAPVIGVVLTFSGVGALMGSAVSAWVSKRWGLGPTLVVSIVVANSAPLLIPFAVGSWYVTAPLIAAALLINGIGLTVYSIQAISVRQAAVSSDVLGRTNAGYRFAVTGTAAIGALLGGVFGSWLGLRPTMVIGVLGTLAALYFVFASPIPKLRNLSEFDPDAGVAGSPVTVLEPGPVTAPGTADATAEGVDDAGPVGDRSTVSR